MNRAGLWRTGSSRSDLWFLLPLEEAFCCSAQWWCNRKQFHVVCNVKISVKNRRVWIIGMSEEVNREFKQPWWHWQRECHKFAYLTMKNNSSACFARALFIFGHFANVLVLSTMSNELFCSCVDYVNIWWQMFNVVFLYRSETMVPI